METTADTRRYARRIDPPTELEGRVGFVRLKRKGICDLGCFVAYGPCCRNAESRRTLRQLLDWMEMILRDLPARCTPFFFTDMNARIGSVLAKKA